VLKWRYKKNARFRTLTIGGGGYTFPKYMEVFYPNADIDVVEIDPEVTKTAYAYLGLPQKTKIQTYNIDGRLFVENCRSSYDVIFIDVFNDLSLPYHLTTKEFGLQMKRILNNDGMVISNIVDDFKKGLFLPSYIKTLREAFGDKNVYLLAVSPDFKDIGISTFIILAVNGNLKIGDFESFLKGGKNKRIVNTVSSVVPMDLLNKIVDGRHSVLLSDDYAPVDNLLAPVFEERFGYNKK
jgi:spermidine synthase